MRVLVCGGRDFDDGTLLSKTLWNIHKEHTISVVIEGGARGADHLAHVWAIMGDFENEQYLADWNQHGKAAGFIRNQQMLDEGKPDLVIAFPGGNGTADMIRRAKKAGIPVKEY